MSVELAPPPDTLERLARFQRLESGNALANYYYAVSLWKGKQSSGALDDATSAQVETLLEKAIQIDPKLAAAYLQLGILYSQNGDLTRAIFAYEKAIAVSPPFDDALEESHYRLAQAYMRAGDKVKAQKELQLHDESSKKRKEDSERQRREIQEFVISLRK